MFKQWTYPLFCDSDPSPIFFVLSEREFLWVQYDTILAHQRKIICYLLECFPQVFRKEQCVIYHPLHVLYLPGDLVVSVSVSVPTC